MTELCLAQKLAERKMRCNAVKPAVSVYSETDIDQIG